MSHELHEECGKEGFKIAPVFFSELIEKHPEVLQISVYSYPPFPHGSIVSEGGRRFVPVNMVVSELIYGHWRLPESERNDLVAIGSVVDVCDIKGCGHSFDEHFGLHQGLWTHWHDNDTQLIGKPQSFVYLDLETYSQSTLNMAILALETENKDWYVLDSGAGYHVVIDKLVELDDLAQEYGSIISFFGNYLESRTLDGWGYDLLVNGGDDRKVELWCEDVLRACGHAEDPIKDGGEVHLIDLRHIAHSLQRALRYRRKLKDYHAKKDEKFVFPPRPPSEIGGAYLRISPKREDTFPPALIAQRVNGIYRDFSSAIPAGNIQQLELRV